MVLRVDLEVFQVDLAGVLVVLLADLGRVDDIKGGGGGNGALELGDGKDGLTDDVMAGHVVVVKHLHLDLPVEVTVAKLSGPKKRKAIISVPSLTLCQ